MVRKTAKNTRARKRGSGNISLQRARRRTFAQAAASISQESLPSTSEHALRHHLMMILSGLERRAVATPPSTSTVACASPRRGVGTRRPLTHA